MLLERGADINAQGRSFYGSALQAASYWGREKIVEIPSPPVENVAM